MERSVPEQFIRFSLAPWWPLVFWHHPNPQWRAEGQKWPDQDLTLANGIMSLFRDFSLIFGLQLSLSKTVIVPLWPVNVTQCCSRLEAYFPEWSEVAIKMAAKYLGFMVGPGKSETSWTPAIARPIDF